MTPIVAVSWAIAVAVALVILGYCAYEIRWKLTRLRADVASLTALHNDVLTLQSQAEATAVRAQTLPTALHHRA